MTAVLKLMNARELGTRVGLSGRQILNYVASCELDIEEAQNDPE